MIISFKFNQHMKQTIIILHPRLWFRFLVQHYRSQRVNTDISSSCQIESWLAIWPHASHRIGETDHKKISCNDHLNIWILHLKVCLGFQIYSDVALSVTKLCLSIAFKVHANCRFAHWNHQLEKLLLPTLGFPWTLQEWYLSFSQHVEKKIPRTDHWLGRSATYWTRLMTSNACISVRTLGRTWISLLAIHWIVKEIPDWSIKYLRLSAHLDSWRMKRCTGMRS